MKVKHINNWFLRHRKILLWTVAGLVGCFIIINLVLFLIFNDRTYPQVDIAGNNIGITRYDKVADRLDELDLLDKEITLHYGDQIIKSTPKDLGASYNLDAIRNQFNQKSWLPIVNLLQTRELVLNIHVDEEVFGKRLQELADEFTKQPSNAKIVVDDTGFILLESIDGHNIDLEKTKVTFMSRVEKGKSNFDIKTRVLQPEVTSDAIRSELVELQKLQNVSIGFTLDDRVVSPSPGDIARWYDETENGYVISDAKITRYIQSIGRNTGVSISNASSATAAVKSTLSSLQPLSFTLLKAAPTITATYCVAARGVSESYLSGLATKAAAVYSDARGWASTGKYMFRQVDSGCSFILWLAAADQMTTFSTDCNPSWSCRVGPNVIINIDRWQDATTAWNQAGGNLDDYRTMVINHETGHWLGFGHWSCSSIGQLAPVMQQQSIDLQGCRFNPWPLDAELSWL